MNLYYTEKNDFTNERINLKFPHTWNVTIYFESRRLRIQQR